jgi:hypothetical protein
MDAAPAGVLRGHDMREVDRFPDDLVERLGR